MASWSESSPDQPAQPPYPYGPSYWVPPPPRQPSRGLAIAFTILIGLWTVGLVVAANAVDWLVHDALLALDVAYPAWVALIVAWLPVLLAGLPALLLGLLSRVDFARAAGQGWAIALLLGAALGTVRLIPLTLHELYLATLALVAGLGAVATRRLSRARRREAAAKPWMSLVALAAGLASLTPWLWAGAFGGLVETLLAAIAALAIGWLASGPVTTLLAAGQRINNRWGAAVIAGLVVGVGLTALAAGVGHPAVQLLILLALPPLAFAIAALARSGSPPVTPLVGTAVFGPLALVDPEETSLILGTHDVAYWALIAAGLAVAVAVLLAVGYIETFGRRIQLRPVLAALSVTVVAACAAIVYIGAGHPGLYGERIFVVMNEQADIGAARGVANREERLRQVYRVLVDTAERSQTPIRKALRDKGINFTPYYLVNGLEVDAGPLVRQWLERRGDVRRILLNPRLRPLPEPPRPMRGGYTAPEKPLWNLTMLGAERVWGEFGTGTGIVVGSSDSGVDGSHPALRGNFRGGDDSWLDQFDSATTPIDRNGHGTHTLATAVGQKVGMAPGARWVACTNLPRNLGNPADYLTCLQFMLAPYPKGGDPLRDGRPERAPHVLTNSWGCPMIEGCDHVTLRYAVAALRTAGIFFVVAAGNSGDRCGSVTSPPATYPEALTVGAVDEYDYVTQFSSRGPAPDGSPKPDLVAPGADVLSALPGGGYGLLDGTSMAAPHVAGLVALMWSANPKLIGDIERTTSILRQTAVPAKVDPEHVCPQALSTTGAGRINAYAAVTAAVAAG